MISIRRIAPVSFQVAADVGFVSSPTVVTIYEIYSNANATVGPTNI